MFSTAFENAVHSYINITLFLFNILKFGTIWIYPASIQLQSALSVSPIIVELRT